MKHLIIIVVFFKGYFCFGQIQQDTIVINFDDIIHKIDTLYNVKTKFVERIIKIDKQSNKPLDGFYKVITSDREYFLTKYKKGGTDDRIFNYKKYYCNGILCSIEIKGIQMIGINYISILEYSCNKHLIGSYLDISSNKKVEDIIIKQRVRKKRVLWKIIRANGQVRKLYLDKDILKDCN